MDRLVLRRGLRVGNGLCLVLFAAALVASFVFHRPIEARLALKYAGVVEPATVLGFVRALMAAALVAAWPIEQLFRALAEMLASVRAGDPFTAGNEARLRTIGWALLALQLLDLVLGGAVWWARAHGIEAVDWTPSLTGWLGVLVAFVLARVFAAGTSLRDDAAGTI